MENQILLWIAAALGAVGIGCRMLRAWGDELLSFARWAREFIDQLRNIIRG